MRFLLAIVSDETKKQHCNIGMTTEFQEWWLNGMAYWFMLSMDGAIEENKYKILSVMRQKKEHCNIGMTTEFQEWWLNGMVYWTEFG